MPDVQFLGRVGLEPGVLFGDGLNGRLSLDLKSLAGAGSAPGVIGNDAFYVRTRVPAGLAKRLEDYGSLDDWSVDFSMGQDASGHWRDFGGVVVEVRVADLRRRAKPMGRHLLECSGNSMRTRFGLLSVAEWGGVRLESLFQETLSDVHSSRLVKISGNDAHVHDGRALSDGDRHGSSVAGASWIFTIDQLQRAGAFLATHMNGERLPLDHGAPVRLVVPGWYGCTCIKWVEQVEVVPQESKRTSQMREFSSRTHQQGQPEFAKDYLPAEIDFAAMAIRMRGPSETGGYWIDGLAWGNPEGVAGLEISVGPAGAAHEARVWQRVDRFELQDRSSWSLWRHEVPSLPAGEHVVGTRAVALAGPVRTRRLDSGYYDRRISV